MKNKFLISVLYHSSIVFTVMCLFSTFVFTVLFWGEEGTQLPSIGFNFALLLISYIVALIISLIIFKVKKPYICEKINVIYLSCALFTYLFLTFNVSTAVFKNIWSEITILSILSVSIIASVVKYLLNIPFGIKIIINFFVFAVPYFGVSVFLGDFGAENKMMILIFVYLLVFAIVTAIIATIRALIISKKNNNTKYTTMFR